MRRVKRLLVTSVAALASIALSASAQAAPTPTLHLVGKRPLVVHGESFQAGEHVVVTAVTSIGPRRITVKATRSGRFRATLRLVDQPCGRATLVVARGLAGSKATLRLLGSPCVPPPVD